MPLFNHLSTVLDCKDGTEDNNGLKIAIDEDTKEILSTCYSAYT